MPFFNVKMRPPKGEPQTFDDNGVERRYIRDITFEAEDREEARLRAERQAWDIAEQYATPRYTIESIREVE